jgi:hypothetical protein
MENNVDEFLTVNFPILLLYLARRLKGLVPAGGKGYSS